MAVIPLINGVEYTFASANFAVSGIPVFGITEISYKVVREGSANIYGAGYEPVARTLGRKVYSGSITLHMSEVEALRNVAPERDLTRLPEFNIGVVFVPEGRPPANHKIRNVRFLNDGLEMSQGDEAVAVQFDLLVGGLEM